MLGEVSEGVSLNKAAIDRIDVTSHQIEVNTSDVEYLFGVESTMTGCKWIFFPCPICSECSLR